MVEYSPNVKGLSPAAPAAPAASAAPAAPAPPAALAGNEIEEYENNRVGTGEQW